MRGEIQLTSETFLLDVEASDTNDNVKTKIQRNNTKHWTRERARSVALFVVLVLCCHTHSLHTSHGSRCSSVCLIPSHGHRHACMKWAFSLTSLTSSSLSLSFSHCSFSSSSSFFPSNSPRFCWSIPCALRQGDGVNWRVLLQHRRWSWIARLLPRAIRKRVWRSGHPFFLSRVRLPWRVIWKKWAQGLQRRWKAWLWERLKLRGPLIHEGKKKRCGIWAGGRSGEAWSLRSGERGEGRLRESWKWSRHRHARTKMARKERENQTRMEKKVNGKALREDDAESEPEKKFISVESEETQDSVRESLKLERWGSRRHEFRAKRAQHSTRTYVLVRQSLRWQSSQILAVCFGSCRWWWGGLHDQFVSAV